MNTSLSNENFGLVIAYILPGFVALWGVSYFSPTVESWITASQQGAPSVAGFMYVTLASLGTGLTVSGVRWLIIDSIHHLTGLTRPAWRFGNLDDKLQGFLTLNEGHYRYYQCLRQYVYRGRLHLCGLAGLEWEGAAGRRVGQPAFRRSGNRLLRKLARRTCQILLSGRSIVRYSQQPQPQERSVSYVEWHR